MKFIITLFVAVTLSSCTIERQVAVPAETTVAVQETTTTTVYVPDEIETWGTDETGFIQATHDKAPITRDLPDYDLLTTGYATCDGFASGLTLDDVVIAISNASGGDADIEDMLQWIAVNAVVYLCPEHAGKINSSI